MIHLDTNILLALPHLIQRDHPLIERVSRGERVSVCVPVWYEFLIGPLSAAECTLAGHFIRNDVQATTAEDADRAVQLFNRAGPKRGLKTDALIAAATIRAGAEFLTLNLADFRSFVREGLRLFETA